MKSILLVIITVLLCSLLVKAQINNNNSRRINLNITNMKMEIPASLEAEHKDLHEALAKYTRLPGKTGTAAKKVAELLHPHFIKEEAYALPPLGLLSEIAKGQTISNSNEVIVMTDKLKNDFPEMVSEHKQIVGALKQLNEAAKSEKHPEVLHFTESLELHAKTEEEVLYPAAILVGEYLKLKS